MTAEVRHQQAMALLADQIEWLAKEVVDGLRLNDIERAGPAAFFLMDNKLVGVVQFAVNTIPTLSEADAAYKQLMDKWPWVEGEPR